MDLIDKTTNQHVNYTSFKEFGFKSGFANNKLIMFVGESNLIKYKTSVSLDKSDNYEIKNNPSNVNMIVDHINFIDLFFKASTNSVMLMDTNGQIKYVNPRFEAVTGYNQQEIIGQSFNILKCWDIESNQHDIFWQTLNQGNEWHGEIKKKKKNGEIFWDYSTIYPVFNESKQITHYLTINEDITRAKQSENHSNYICKNSVNKYLLRVEFLARISNEIKVNLKIISDYIHVINRIINKDEYKYLSIYFDAVNNHIEKLFSGVEEFSKEDPAKFNPLQSENIFKFLKEVQVPVKVIIRLVNYLKNELGKDNNDSLLNIFKDICNLGEKVLKITMLINDLSKGEIDEEKYLNKVLRRITIYG